jgi:4-hydroxy-3-methylbut-2-enyl diphosphate reductase
MKLLLASPRGFCAGVVRAIETVEKAISLWGAPIYVKHHIVHNRHVVNELIRNGAVFVEEIDEIPEGQRVIYSAHGVSPEVRELAKKRGLIEIDATCSLVTRVHSAVKRFAAKGYQIILIGHRNHVETIGTAGEAPLQTTVIEKVEDVELLSYEANAPLFYATQTTLSLDDVGEIAKKLIEKFPHIETLPTSSICYATTNRQMALSGIASEVDLVLVVGDPMSSNSNRLCEIARNRGIKAHLINSKEEIEVDWMDGVRVVGLTAGASTPEGLVEDCIKKLYELGVTSQEEVVLTQENVLFQLPREVLI